MEAFRSHRSHANYCNPSNLELKFTLILPLPEILSVKLKFYTENQKLAKFQKIVQNRHFTFELLKLDKQN